MTRLRIAFAATCLLPGIFAGDVRSQEGESQPKKPTQVVPVQLQDSIDWAKILEENQRRAKGEYVTDRVLDVSRIRFDPTVLLFRLIEKCTVLVATDNQRTIMLMAPIRGGFLDRVVDANDTSLITIDCDNRV